MFEVDDSEYISYLFEPPLGAEEEKLGWLGKNIRHVNYLIEEANHEANSTISKNIFEELKELMTKSLIVEPPESFALVCMCKLVAGVAEPWEIPCLVKLLYWGPVINARDNSCIAVLIEAVKEKGYSQDVRELKRFDMELGKLERYSYQDGAGARIPFPGMINLRLSVRGAIEHLKIRGPRGEPSIVGGLTPAGF